MSDPRELVGRRFMADFKVVAIGEQDGEQVAVLHMYGDRYRISVAELLALVEAGIVVEAPERRQP